MFFCSFYDTTAMGRRTASMGSVEYLFRLFYLAHSILPMAESPPAHGWIQNILFCPRQRVAQPMVLYKNKYIQY